VELPAGAARDQRDARSRRAVDASPGGYSPKFLRHAQLDHAHSVSAQLLRVAGCVLSAWSSADGFVASRSRLLQAVEAEDWRTFAALACISNEDPLDPTGGKAARPQLSAPTVAACREAAALLAGWENSAGKRVPG
jgi:hypothetical protein